MMENKNLATGHLVISILKSFIRIIGGLSTFVGVFATEDVITGLLLLSGTLVVAEILGIVEEAVDERK